MISKIKLLTTVLVLAASSASCYAEPKGHNESNATVYFMPFEFQTITFETKQGVISDATEKWTISNDDKVAKLADLLEQGQPAVFNDEMIRVAIVLDDKTYYMDSEGVVLKGKKGVKVDKAEFMKFRNSLGRNERQVLVRVISNNFASY